MQTWAIAKTIYRVSDFVAWQRSGALELSPSFQRRPVWARGAKSLLIDTIATGLPMPVLFLRDIPSGLDTMEPVREVVDGQQRIRTVLSFVAPHLLTDLDPERDVFTVMRSHNRDLAGHSFAELPEEVRQRILDYQFSVQVFPSSTDDRDILQIFARMNATGVKLNAQELRNAEFYGEFKTLMYELASEQLERWRRWQIFNESTIARMDEVELTSEFALLMLNGVAGKDSSAITRAYRERDDTFPEARVVARRFRAVMDAIEDKLGPEIPHTAFRRRTLFYSLFAAFYDHLWGLESPLSTSERLAKLDTEWVSWVRSSERLIADSEAPLDVLESAARRTTHVSSRRRLVKYLSAAR